MRCIAYWLSGRTERTHNSNTIGGADVTPAGAKKKGARVRGRPVDAREDPANRYFSITIFLDSVCLPAVMR
jgi:hypothetical protein